MKTYSETLEQRKVKLVANIITVMVAIPAAIYCIYGIYLQFSSL